MWNNRFGEMCFLQHLRWFFVRGDEVHVDCDQILFACFEHRSIEEWYKFADDQLALSIL